MRRVPESCPGGSRENARRSGAASRASAADARVNHQPLPAAFDGAAHRQPLAREPQDAVVHAQRPARGVNVQPIDRDRHACVFTQIEPFDPERSVSARAVQFREVDGCAEVPIEHDLRLRRPREAPLERAVIEAPAEPELARPPATIAGAMRHRCRRH